MGSAPAAHSGQKIIRSGRRFLSLGEVVQMAAVLPRRSGLVGEGSRRRRRRAGLVVVEKSGERSLFVLDIWIAGFPFFAGPGQEAAVWRQHSIGAGGTRFPTFLFTNLFAAILVSDTITYISTLTLCKTKRQSIRLNYI
jgi:hypothetical protein